MRDKVQLHHYLVGVDSGMLWIGDPAYLNRPDVQAFREKLMTGQRNPNPCVSCHNDQGIAFLSGYGDGLYDVTLEIREDGRVCRAVITLIVR